jgi:hypothetical protein
MRLPPFGFARAFAVIAVAGFIVSTPAGLARAQVPQAPATHPVITFAPDVVGFLGHARIKGRLRDGRPGEEVTLERRLPHAEWRRIATATTDTEGEVRFRVGSLRRTSGYRLVWTDEATGAPTYSDATRIRVRPRLTLRASRTRVLEGGTVLFYGVLRPATAGRDVILQHRASGEWRTFARVGASDGDFVARFEPRRTGRRRFRVLFRGDEFNSAGTRGRRAIVYRRTEATWYGPGFYGNTTACGRRYGYDMLGVAHRSLPCGTEVALFHGGRFITVRVVDRGPYTSADFDLTRETAERLGFSGRGTIGVLVQ